MIGQELINSTPKDAIVALKSTVVEIVNSKELPFTQADIILECSELMSDTSEEVQSFLDYKTLTKVVIEQLDSMYQQGLIDSLNGILTRVNN